MAHGLGPCNNHYSLVSSYNKGVGQNLSFFLSRKTHLDVLRILGFMFDTPPSPPLILSITKFISFTLVYYQFVILFGYTFYLFA